VTPSRLVAGTLEVPGVVAAAPAQDARVEIVPVEIVPVEIVPVLDGAAVAVLAVGAP